MPPYEYRVLKIPIKEQEFYNRLMRSFGWQVQNMQEMVDRVETHASDNNSSSVFGQGNATIRNPTGRYTYVSGNGFSRQTGSQSHSEITEVHTLLSVTYMRDLALPSRNQLAALEQQCLNAYEEYQRTSTGVSSHRWNYLLRKGQNILMGPQTILPSVKFINIAIKHERFKYSGGEGYSGGTSDYFDFILSFDIYNAYYRHCEVKFAFMDQDGKPIEIPNSMQFIRPEQQSVHYEFGSGKGTLGSTFKDFHRKDRRGEIQYYAWVVDLTTDSCIAKTDVRKFSYIQPALGKLEITDLIKAPVKTIGRTP